MSIFNSQADLGSSISSLADVGRTLKPAQVNGLFSATRSLIAGENVMPGPNIRIDRGPNGIVISGMPKGSSASTVSNPFQLYLAANPDAEVGGSVVRVTPGLVNEVYPIIGSVTLDQDIAGFPAAEGNVYVKADWTKTENVWSFEMVFLDTSPTDESITRDLVRSYRKIGTVARIAGELPRYKVAQQFVTSHLFLFSYGNLNVWARA